MLTHDKLDLCKKYNPTDYPKYDNYDAINVDKTSDIPEDYDGIIGVPITFLDKYCPEQFEIVGRGGDIDWAMSSECDFYIKPDEKKAEKLKKADKTWRIQNPYFYDGTTAQTIYTRLFIKRKS